VHRLDLDVDRLRDRAGAREDGMHRLHFLPRREASRGHDDLREQLPAEDHVTTFSIDAAEAEAPLIDLLRLQDLRQLRYGAHRSPSASSRLSRNHSRV
jgi:hypothetical protein